MAFVVDDLVSVTVLCAKIWSAYKTGKTAFDWVRAHQQLSGAEAKLEALKKVRPGEHGRIRTSRMGPQRRTLRSEKARQTPVAAQTAARAPCTHQLSRPTMRHPPDTRICAQAAVPGTEEGCRRRKSEGARRKDAELFRKVMSKLIPTGEVYEEITPGQLLHANCCGVA
jgi:hypothetical protein|eukprot:5107972-Prymnesium_polylepis.2